MNNQLIDCGLKEPFSKILQAQITFQKFIGNEVPESIVSFENVQTALSHNIYQQIELQEFLEADTDSAKEELIDYFLFMLNKYIYLGVNCVPYTIFDILWDTVFVYNKVSCLHYANIEQDNFITFIRKAVVFKPWKRRNGEDCCEDKNLLYSTFYFSMEQFSNMAKAIFDDDYREFIRVLNNKLNVNIERQKSNY